MSERFTRRRTHYVAVACALAAALLASGAFAQYSARWRVQLGDEAKSEGSLIFNVEQQAGSTLQVFVEIAGGSPRNVIAAAIRDAFREQLPEEAFEIEVDDRDNVLLRKKGDAPEFDVTLLRSTVTALRVKLDRR